MNYVKKWAIYIALAAPLNIGMHWLGEWIDYDTTYLTGSLGMVIYYNVFYVMTSRG